MRGTDIYYISGRKNRGIGLLGGPTYPTGLTADSTPVIDEEWNPFQDFWNEQAYQDWFTMNVTAYGQATAVTKMQSAIDSWDFLGEEVNYCNDASFIAFFQPYNINVSNVFCNFNNAVANTANNVSTAVQNVSQAATNLTSSASSLIGLLPIIALAGGVFFGYKYLESSNPKMAGRKKSSHAGTYILGGSVVLGLLVASKSGIAAPSATLAPSTSTPGNGSPPLITIERIDTTANSMQYSMTVNGYNMNDTVYSTDGPQVVPAGDGVHYFLTSVNPDGSGIMFTIATQSSPGNYQALVSDSISFSFPQDQLPDVITES